MGGIDKLTDEEMKQFLKKTTLIIALLSPLLISAQQDPQYSQYMFNPLSINPAYSGSRGVMNGALVYRNQWVSFPGAPNTQVLAINTPLKKGKVGIGFELVRDQIGPKNTGAGFMNFRINWDQISYKDQQDHYAQLSAMSTTLPDFKFGMYFNNKKTYAGFSVTHLNKPNYGTFVIDTVITTASLRRHAFFTFGRAFALGSDFTFSPSIIARSVVNLSNASVDVNLNFRYKEIMWFGVSARSEQSLVVMAQYAISEKLHVGYSYDMSLGRLRNYHSGTHEIMLGFNLDIFQSDIMSPRYF
jgi:hypothetical protein